jgi:protein gp37
MGKTNIEWCDYTFNAWIGCSKISPGCQNCYAEKTALRRHWVNKWGVDYHRTAADNWKNPLRWAKAAVAAGEIWRVFCLSLGDIFDPKVPVEWRDQLWQVIIETGSIGGLEWLLLTKRPEHIERFVPRMIGKMANVRIGVTCENQEMADARLPVFLNAWRGKNFISIEPMLSEIDLSRYTKTKEQKRDEIDAAYWCFYRQARGKPPSMVVPEAYWPCIDWIVCGCESGPGARGCNPLWLRSLRDQCQRAGIPFMLKQARTNHGALIKRPLLDGRQYLEFPKAG